MQLFDEHQIEFLRSKAQTKEGLEWIGLIQSLINTLYYSKGVTAEELQPRQIAAQLLEKLITVAEDRKPKPKINGEYL